jgi:hypothetical protein
MMRRGERGRFVKTEKEAPSQNDAAKLETLAQEAERPPEAPVPEDARPGYTKGGKKIGRPPGSATRTKTARQALVPKPAAPVIPEPILLGVIHAPYIWAAKRYGEHWLLTDDEAKAMAPAHLALAEEYLPAVMKDRPALYSVLLLHALTVFGRVQMGIEIAARAEAKAEPLRPVTAFREPGFTASAEEAPRPAETDSGIHDRFGVHIADGPPGSDNAT